MMTAMSFMHSDAQMSCPIGRVRDSHTGVLCMTDLT